MAEVRFGESGGVGRVELGEEGVVERISQEELGVEPLDLVL